jgi:uncharacterized protein (TIGR03435 family)
MNNHIGHKLIGAKGMSLIGTSILAIAMPISIDTFNPLEVKAQPPGAPTFDVASVKANKTGSTASRISSGPDGSLHAINVTPKSLILDSFRVMDFRLSGAPTWIATERFDIEAKPDPMTRQPDIRPMIRSLLEQRFQLRTHREARELPVFILDAAKSGPKVPEAAEGEAQSGGLRPGASRTSVGPKGGEISGNAIPIAKFIEMLMPQVGRPVLDRTGLVRKYDISLKFFPDSTTPGVEAGPSIFTALQEQMGLRLEASREIIEMLVIDHVERPSEN